MQMSQLTLLSQLAHEYTDLINTATSTFSPKHINELDNDDECNYSNADDEKDDFDDRLREVEDEIVMAMADISCKRVNPTNEYNNCIKTKGVGLNMIGVSSILLIHLPCSDKNTRSNTAYGTQIMFLILI